MVNPGAIMMTKQGPTVGPTYRSNVLETFQGHKTCDIRVQARKLPSD